MDPIDNLELLFVRNDEQYSRLNLKKHALGPSKVCKLLNCFKFLFSMEKMKSELSLHPGRKSDLHNEDNV